MIGKWIVIPDSQPETIRKVLSVSAILKARDGCYTVPSNVLFFHRSLFDWESIVSLGIEGGKSLHIIDCELKDHEVTMPPEDRPQTKSIPFSDD